MAQHGRFKAFSLLLQRFKLSSACQILSFFLNKVLICLETLQSSPAAVPVALGEQRVGSLPLSPAQRTKRGPLLFLSVGTMVQEERGRARHWAEDLKWPSTTCQHGPLSFQTTQNHITGACFGKDEVLPGWTTLQTSGQQRPSAGPCISRHFTSNTGFFIQLHQKTKYFPLSLTPPSPMGINLTMEMNWVTLPHWQSHLACSY